MAHAHQQPCLTADDYLAWEAEQSERHEYIDGEAFATAGAEDRHVTVAGNLYMSLRHHLRGSRCRTFMSDMRLQVQASNAYFYPDVMVTGSDADHASSLSKSEPVLLCEVLSPGTGHVDRGAKFAHDRRVASLREYVLVDIGLRAADVYRKGEDGLWVLHPFGAAEALELELELELASVDLSVPAAELYADVDPPAATPDGAPQT